MASSPDRPGVPPVSVAPTALSVDAMREFRRLYQAPEGLFWLKRVNHTIGALIAYLLYPTRVTPNAVSVAGLVAHLIGAVMVAIAAPPVGLPWVIAVASMWQLAFALDCADGPLARARRQTSEFGAWFDQIIDVISHTAVYAALIVFVVRALALDSVFVALFASLTVAATLIQTFTTWQRQSMIRDRPVTVGRSAVFKLVYLGRHFVDYGAFLFAASALLLWPLGLLVFVSAASLLNAGYVAGQVALNWRRAWRASRGGSIG